MAIREGESQDRFLTDQHVFTTYYGFGESVHTHEIPVSFSSPGRNRFRHKFNYNGLTFTLSCKSYMPEAIEATEPEADGVPVVELVYADSLERRSFVLAAGEMKKIGKLNIALDPVVSDAETVVLSSAGDSLSFLPPSPYFSPKWETVPLIHPLSRKVSFFIPRQLYSIRGSMLVLSQYLPKGKIVARTVRDHGAPAMDALVMEMTSGPEKTDFVLWGKPGMQGKAETLKINGIDFIISYGSVYKSLPFKLTLKDFVLHRYPGSQSPSGFESHVILTDAERKVENPFRIYMNNILKYRGYRFFQSSYDRDEKGTILSVNHDLAGTLITYAGYLLMGLGMALSLVNRNSRFRALSEEITRLKKDRKELGLLFLLVLLLLPQTTNARPELSSATPAVVNKEHAAEFGRLLVQDNNGRIEPVNTLSAEVLRKLSRRNSYKGLNADQVFLGMITDPYTWQNEEVIRATHPDILDIMESTNRYFSFTDFFINDQYILQSYVEAAYRKKPAFRSKFDNEIIRLDERINVLYLVFTGEMLRVLPMPGDSNHTWYSHQGIQHKVATPDSAMLENLLSYYQTEVQHSMQTGDWTNPDNIIEAISDLQIRYSGHVIPSPRKVKVEIFLNKASVFAKIADYYGIIGSILLLLQFAGLAFKRIQLKVPVVIAMWLIIILFTCHTTGLALRWYISGHAPWSNGYEALVFIAWATYWRDLFFPSERP